jgi:hypothetical protein
MTPRETLCVTLFALWLAVIPVAYAVGLSHGHALRPVYQPVPVSDLATYAFLGTFGADQ